jgi:hypothetical protein
MAQTLTLASVFLAAGFLMWRFRHHAFANALHVDVRLDRSAPGAHLIWHIVNAGKRPITLTKLIVKPRSGAALSVGLDSSKLLQPQDHVIVPTDVDWSLLSARSVAAVDALGGEHSPPRKQLEAIKGQLRELIDRRVYATTAGEFLLGATNLAMGVVILGLGVFMLMWVIATG